MRFALTQRYRHVFLAPVVGGHRPRDRYLHAPLIQLLPELTACEPVVGYKGIAVDKCAYESHAWRQPMVRVISAKVDTQGM